jgi:hypothetical protein
VNGVGLQRVKQEDKPVRLIEHRHVSTIRVMYLLHYLMHVVRRSGEEMGSAVYILYCILI